MFNKILTLCFILTVNSMLSAENPQKGSTMVEDASALYYAEDWIISPDEEPAEDYGIVFDCDIYAVLSCYDEDYLAFDILLQNSLSWEKKTIYGVCIDYQGYSEYYYYDVYSEELIFEKVKGGKTVESKILNTDDGIDSASVIYTEEYGEDDINITLNKLAHFKGTKGKQIVLTCTFFAGYWDEKGIVQIDDETITVDLVFGY